MERITQKQAIEDLMYRYNNRLHTNLQGVIEDALEEAQKLTYEFIEIVTRELNYTDDQRQKDYDKVMEQRKRIEESYRIEPIDDDNIEQLIDEISFEDKL